MIKNAIEITQNLIRCPSVTPADEGAQVYLTKVLEEAGFTVFQLPFGDVPNIFARIGTGSPHICYGGHTDVVPPGHPEKWTNDPFDPVITDGVMYGRGTSDMKGSVACFAAAAIDYVAKHGAPANGSISMLITGDEEGSAVDGTIKVLEWMKENDHLADVYLVGEPTNPKVLGEEIKIGRRGSMNGFLTVQGKQGHVAYPERSNNPMPLLIKLCDALASYAFDEGTEFFGATNLEVTTIDVGNPAVNVIPDSGEAQFNIRFNDKWSYETLGAKVREVLDAVSTDYKLKTSCGAESFITQPGEWTDVVLEAVKDVTGRVPEFTTTGGTSDARFTVQYGPTVEFGPINDTIHQIDENAEVAVLEDVTKIFSRVLELYFKP
ncbi:succinyl-diaminopimelate desuccinylase [Alphaproteobacteria bacterium]|nr:succinyl-diaminopimelate desuccinylase [Alphaproteobacteria bacterium]